MPSSPNGPCRIGSTTSTSASVGRRESAPAPGRSLGRSRERPSSLRRRAAAASAQRPSRPIATVDARQRSGSSARAPSAPTRARSRARSSGRPRARRRARGVTAEAARLGRRRLAVSVGAAGRPDERADDERTRSPVAPVPPRADPASTTRRARVVGVLAAITTTLKPASSERRRGASASRPSRRDGRLGRAPRDGQRHRRAFADARVRRPGSWSTTMPAGWSESDVARATRSPAPWSSTRARTACRRRSAPRPAPGPSRR